jgi:ABC-2 type transport system ATP-binding protein
MSSEQVLVKLEQVSRYYGTHTAVDSISFEVRRGEVLGFLGPNGAGKSTTMQILTGNLAPSAGLILINDIDILDQPKAAKAHIGYLPEQPPLYRELTVLEYLDYCARLNRIPKNQINSAVDKAIERCALGEVRTRLISNLSKGFQQRVGIAQAIIHTPAIVVLDEPTVGLDPIQIREIRNLIKEIGDDHSVILSTHILQEVQSVCDRVQIISRGKLVYADTIAGLRTHIDTTAIIVRLEMPPESKILQALPGVQDVRELSAKKFRLQYGETNPTEALLAAAVTNRWQLTELYPDRLSLEDVFMEMTATDHTSGTAMQELTP